MNFLIKSIRYSLACMFALSSLFWAGCDGDGICTRDNGDVVTEVLAIPDFEGIDLQISGDVFLTQGSPQLVEVRGASNLIEKLRRDVDNGVWDIDFRGCVSNMDDFDVFITVPNLDYVKLSGSGEIVTDNRFDVNYLDVKLSGSGKIFMDADADDVDLRISGSGRINMDVTADNIVSTISGSGKLDMTGEADTHDLKISGSGDLFGFDLITQESIMLISGSGDAEVYADDILDVRISGSGDVFYKGNPQLDVSVSGSGRVVNAN